jgi:hypothetical protein
MDMNANKHNFLYTVLVLTATLASAPLFAQPAGEQWEYQGTMNMMGMKMPIPLTQRCENPELDRTPPVDSNCTISDVTTEGNLTSFTMHCGDPNPMEGSGTTLRTGDQLESNYTVKTAEGEVSFSMTGKKLGACAL